MLKKFNRLIWKGFYSYRIKDKLKNVKNIEINIPEIDFDLFRDASRFKFNQLEKALLELNNFDENIESIKRYKDNNLDENLDIIFKDKSIYKLKICLDEKLLYLVSSESGIYKYYYDNNEERFYNDKDNHLFDELLSRDLLKLTKAYLNI